MPMSRQDKDKIKVLGGHNTFYVIKLDPHSCTEQGPYIWYSGLVNCDSLLT